MDPLNPLLKWGTEGAEHKSAPECWVSLVVSTPTLVALKWSKWLFTFTSQNTATHDFTKMSFVLLSALMNCMKSCQKIQLSVLFSFIAVTSSRTQEPEWNTEVSDSSVCTNTVLPNSRQFQGSLGSRWTKFKDNSDNVIAWKHLSSTAVALKPMCNCWEMDTLLSWHMQNVSCTFHVSLQC